MHTNDPLFLSHEDSFRYSNNTQASNSRNRQQDAAPRYSSKTPKASHNPAYNAKDSESQNWVGSYGRAGTHPTSSSRTPQQAAAPRHSSIYSKISKNPADNIERPRSRSPKWTEKISSDQRREADEYARNGLRGVSPFEEKDWGAYEKARAGVEYSQSQKFNSQYDSSVPRGRRLDRYYRQQ